ncbi:hypothetical protein Syun_030291 [Stephania yunnanensis]|uniref:Uncharacterized protein n=1 Tax=Stephania yunnanensis TaxID=152371 RepID=A0AAP0HKD6_9MAGN
MAKQYCEDSYGRSSAPVPIIGLYIAGISLVCLLLMLWDIYVAFRRKHFHIPCRCFKLNSITLTLLAIVAKLPVDLTTNMPSAADQLSKLTGTAMICICIGFMAPSLASSTVSEDKANVASLGIFIVTVVVNICVQMRTGVIFSFVPEHITIMCFMFILLFFLCTHIRYNGQSFISEYNVQCFHRVEDEEVSLIQRVKSWYISACICNPQLFICRIPLIIAVGPICIMCSLILLQAICRAMVVVTIEFCIGVFVYGWSMQIIVIIQIVTIIIGVSTIAFRWLAILHYFDADIWNEIVLDTLKGMKHVFSKRELKMSSRMRELISLLFAVFAIFVSVPTHAISFIISRIPSGIKLKLRCCMHKPRDDILSSFPWIKKYSPEKMVEDVLVQRAIEVCVDNMNKWRNIVKRDPSPYHHTIEMLSRSLGCSATSPQLLNSFRDIGRKRIKGYNVTTLTMVVLVKVVAERVPDPSIPVVKSMRDTLGEAFQILHYVDKKMNVKIKDSEKRKLAKKLWKEEDFYRRMKEIFKKGYEIVPDELADDESKVVSDFIGQEPYMYETIDALCSDVQQLFCETLHHFLAQLPICVYKDVHEGAVEDCEKRAKYITKCLCQMDPLLEGLVQWQFPDGWPANSSRIFDSNAQNDISSTEDGGNITNITAQNNVTDQRQHPSDQIQPADASSNV